jgi:murein DD-endopeptidase MepM/ murein hydrolase activator NlpD
VERCGYALDHGWRRCTSGGRLGFTALLVLVMLLAALPNPNVASAKTAEQLKAELEQLKAETRDAGNAFDRAYWQLDETEVRIDRTDKRIAVTQKRLLKAKKRLSLHAASIYRRGDFSLFEFLMGAASFDDLVTRMDYLRRIGASDAEAIADVKSTRQRLKSQRAELVKESKNKTAALASLRSERDRLQTRLKLKQADFVRVKAQLDAIRGGPNRPDGMMGVPGPNGMVFPVRGSYYYANTWGASRSGGRRRHQGTDIMAARGTPLVAITSGTVSVSNNGLGGKCIWLSGARGWRFYYAHLDGFAVRSGHVKAGQVIGYVGSTGNAAGGAPHLHLQMHPGGGGPVNPYPYLRAME